MRIFRALVPICAVGLAGCGGDSGGNVNSNGNGAAKQSVVNYSSCGNLPSYAAELGGNLLRWKQFPVTVKIDLTNAPRVTQANNRVQYTTDIKAGAQAWKVAGDGRLGDVVFVDSDDADIVIKFGVTRTVSEFANTDTHRDGFSPTSYIDKGTVITLSTLSFDRFISDNAWSTLIGSPNFDYTLTQSVAHEMGHALFANGHSSQGQDIMVAGFRPLASAPVFLSQRDINSIREAYCRPLGSG